MMYWDDNTKEHFIAFRGLG